MLHFSCLKCFYNFGALDSLTNSTTNMAEHLHEGWAVSRFRENFDFQHRFSLTRLFQTLFFSFGGGGGGGGGQILNNSQNI